MRGMIALVALSGCSLLRSAEKDPAAAFAHVRDSYAQGKADAEKACQSEPALEQAGILRGKAADDARAFCADLKLAP